jgi:hypothetical protein
MWQQIIVGIIVLVAAIMVWRSLRKAAAGDCGCGGSSCGGCPLAGECHELPPPAADSDSEPPEA